MALTVKLWATTFGLGSNLLDRGSPLSFSAMLIAEMMTSRNDTIVDWLPGNGCKTS